MKETVYNQINPLIRLKEMELLSAGEYQQLLEADSMTACGEILKHTIYAPYVKEGFEENFEAIYGKEQGKLYEWLYEKAPEPEIISIYTSRFTFHNLKVLTKAEKIEKNLDHLFIYDGRYTLETIKSAVHTRNSSELEESLLDSIREVFDYLEESTLSQAIDIIYDRHFLRYQKQLAEALSYPEIIEEIESFIDMTNISTVARGIAQGQHKNFLTAVLSSAGTIAKEELVSFSNSTLAEFTSYVLTTRYGGKLSNIVSSETKELDLVAFERVKDNYLTSLYEKAKVVAFGPLPLIAFLNAKEIEWKNLRLLLIGKRSGFSRSQIEERMRSTNDL